MRAQEAEGWAAHPHSGLGQDRMPGAWGRRPPTSGSLIPSLIRRTLRALTRRVRLGTGHTTLCGAWVPVELRSCSRNALRPGSPHTRKPRPTNSSQSPGASRCLINVDLTNEQFGGQLLPAAPQGRVGSQAFEQEQAGLVVDPSALSRSRA